MEKRTNDLFYDNLDLCQVILTATPVERIKQSGEGKGNKYFIAEFTYKPLENKALQEILIIGDGLNIWRAGTLTGDAQTELSVNYRPPIQLLNGTGTIEEGAAKNEQEETSTTDSEKKTKAA